MKEKIIAIVSQACAIEELVCLQSELKSLSIDSLTFVEMLVQLEEEFEIEFDFDELNEFNCITIGDIVRVVEKKINEKD